MRTSSTFAEVSFSFRRLRTTPAKKPCTECGCQPVALSMALMVTPFGDWSIVITWACLQWERRAFDSALASGFQRALQTDLHQFGDPTLHDMQDNYAEKCTTVGVLVRHLRNAVSHGRFIFSGESRNLEDVSIKFFDEHRRTRETWTATIDGVDLRE